MTAAPGTKGIAIWLVIRHGASQSRSCLRCPAMAGWLHRKIVLHASRRHASERIAAVPRHKAAGARQPAGVAVPCRHA